MNANVRKEIAKHIDALNDIRDNLESIRDDEEEKYDNMPENLQGSERAEEIVQNINNNQRQVRYELGTRVGKQLRIIPELKFFIDDSLDYVEHIDELLKH